MYFNVKSPWHISLLKITVCSISAFWCYIFKIFFSVACTGHSGRRRLFWPSKPLPRPPHGWPKVLFSRCRKPRCRPLLSLWNPTHSNEEQWVSHISLTMHTCATLYVHFLNMLSNVCLHWKWFVMAKQPKGCHLQCSDGDWGEQTGNLCN